MTPEILEELGSDDFLHYRDELSALWKAAKNLNFSDCEFCEGDEEFDAALTALEKKK